MDLSRILPNSAKNKQEDGNNAILYLFLVEFGWSYEQFINTPVPVVFRLMKYHKYVKEQERKNSKRKK